MVTFKKLRKVKDHGYLKKNVDLNGLNQETLYK
jgi:hypothetical protein